MSLPDFTFRTLALLSAGIGLTVSVPSDARAQGPVEQRAGAAVDKPPDKAVDAMRREVEARKRERDAILAKIKIRRVPVQQPPFVQIVGVPMVAAGRNRGPWVEQIVENDDEFDENSPESQLAYTEEAFDHFVLGGGTINDQRRLLIAMLTARVQQATRRYGLGLDRQRTLQLAGMGAIKRCLDPIERQREEWKVVRMDLNKARTFIGQAQMLRTTDPANVFGSESLYNKALNKMLIKQAAARAAAASPKP